MCSQHFGQSLALCLDLKAGEKVCLDLENRFQNVVNNSFFKIRTSMNFISEQSIKNGTQTSYGDFSAANILGNQV